MKLKWYYAILIPISAIILAVILNFIPIQHAEDQSPDPLPEVRVSLANTTLSNILAYNKTATYQNNQIAIVDGEQASTFTDVEFKGRGNSTWGWPKSPFQIKFDSKVDLFNMGAAKKWLLLANYFDKSNLRNDIAFYIAGLLGQDYAISGQFVKFYIDDEYLGLYYLTEKIEIDKNRINLKNEDAIIVELDNLHAATDFCDYLTKENSCLNIKDLRTEDNETKAFAEFTAKFSDLEQAAKNHDYEKVKSLADVESFAKYYLLSDFTVNPDSYSSSFYFYLDGHDDKIHAGPSWDFDLSLGSYVWSWAKTDEYYSPDTIRTLETYALGGSAYDEKTDSQIKIEPDPSHTRLLFNLCQIPEFRTEIQTIYRDTLMHKKEQTLSYIRAQAEVIREAAIEDRTMWRDEEPTILYAMGLAPDLAFTEDELLDGTNPPKEQNPDNLTEYQAIRNKVFRSNLSSEEAFDQDVNFLLDWISRRFDYLDREYSGLKRYKEL